MPKEDMTFSEEEEKIWEKQNVNEKEIEIDRKSRGFDETEEEKNELGFLDGDE